MKSRLIVFLCACLFSVSALATEIENSRQIVLSLPELNWALVINAPGFFVEDFEIVPHGDAARFQAVNVKTGIIMSGFLEKAAKKGNSEDCRTYYWARAQKSPFLKTDIKMSKSGEMALVEYIVKDFIWKGVNQKNINAYLAESDYWIDIHLSKTRYKPSDQQLFKTLLSQVKIKKDYKSDSLILFHFGEQFYWQKKYSKSATYYQQALNLENKKRTLPKTFWLLLVDHLGVSYGYSRNLDKAKEIYSTALLKEMEYPMFYYNLACVYAETNDLNGAIKNLKLAYKYKKNMMPWEEFPDPRTDSSFKRFLNNKTFIREVKKMSVTF